MFLINDPYKLVSSTGKYKICEQISSYCYLTIKDAYTLYQQYFNIEKKNKRDSKRHKENKKLNTK
jgi:hypothetical protein